MTPFSAPLPALSNTSRFSAYRGHIPTQRRLQARFEGTRLRPTTLSYVFIGADDADSYAPTRERIYPRTHVLTEPLQPQRKSTAFLGPCHLKAGRRCNSGGDDATIMRSQTKLSSEKSPKIAATSMIWRNSDAHHCLLCRCENENTPFIIRFLFPSCGSGLVPPHGRLARWRYPAEYAQPESKGRP